MYQNMQNMQNYRRRPEVIIIHPNQQYQSHQ